MVVMFIYIITPPLKGLETQGLFLNILITTFIK